MLDRARYTRPRRSVLYFHISADYITPSSWVVPHQTPIACVRPYIR
nr:MAG TPA: hypothetical protein [Caudoviricetes sp.]